jgi:hypothetical protein
MFDQAIDGGPDDVGHRSAPPAVNRGGYLSRAIDEQNRNAVGRGHADYTGPILTRGPNRIRLAPFVELGRARTVPPMNLPNPAQRSPSESPRIRDSPEILLDPFGGITSLRADV